MKIELKPTTVRAALIGGGLAVLVALMSRIPLIDRLAGLLVLALAIGVGAYSVMLAHQAGNTSGEPAQDAVDGALASAIGMAGWGILLIVLNFIFAAPQVNSAADVGFLALCLGGGVIFSACAFIVFGGVLGAIGGVGYGLYKKQQAGGTMAGSMAPQPPPSMGTPPSEPTMPSTGPSGTPPGNPPPTGPSA